MRQRFIAFCALVCLGVIPIYARFQRIGLHVSSPIRISGGGGGGVAGGGGSAIVNGFCLDPHLDPPPRQMRYGNVLEGSANLLVQVGNNAPIPLSQALGTILDVDVREATGFEGGILEAVFRSRIKEPITIRPADAKDAVVAFGDEPGTVLHAEKAAVVLSTDNPEYWATTEDLHALRSLGYDIPSTAEGLGQTIRAYQRSRNLDVDGKVGPQTRAAMERDQYQILAQTGHVGFGGDDLGHAIAKYEEHLGLPLTGRMSDTIRSHVEADEKTLAWIRQGAQPSDDMPSVLATEASPNERVVMLQRRGYVETWGVTDYGVMRTRGTSALAQLDKASSHNTWERIGDENVVIIQAPAQLESSPRTIMVNGSRRPWPRTVETEEEAWFDVVSDITADADAESGIRPRVIVRPSIASKLNLDNGMVGIGADEKLIVPDPVTLAVLLRNRLGSEADVMLMSDVDRGLENLSHLPTLEKGSQIRVYVDRQRLGDYDIVENIRPALQDAKMEILQVGGSDPGSPRIVLFAGHNSAEFRQMVDAMATEGKFKDAIIAFAICGQGGEMPFNAGIIAKSGARGILFFDQKINAQAVEDVLVQFAGLLHSEGAPAAGFQALWRRSVEMVYEAAPATEKEEIAKLRGAVLQLSLGPVDERVPAAA